MTGFGRGESEENGYSWIVEIKTVNHRFLDQRIQLPRSVSALEDRVRQMVASRLDRGRVEVGITLINEPDTERRLMVNSELVHQYHACLKQIRYEVGAQNGITLADMLTCRELISQEEEGVDLEAAWQALQPALLAAIDECDRMREQEGQRLKAELLARLSTFEKLIQTVENSIDEILSLRQQELKNRIEKLLGEIDLDPVRLAQEAALMADKADVTEEIVRLKSHIEQFRAFLSLDEPVGRRLDFLLQEFLREVNTLASKISNASIAHLAVEMKNEIEKLREQVQNIE
jgi:uncharacterized protein (TIGR00255 family)